MQTDRREFLKGVAALGIASLCGKTWADMAGHPSAGGTLPAWKPGTFRIATLYTGRSEATFLIFPDGTSALIDCGDYSASGVPAMPDPAVRPGESVARWILADNPHGKNVDYFILTHYHSDHCGHAKHSAGRSKRGDYLLSGVGQAMEMLDFDKMIDRSWPKMEDPAPSTDGFAEGSVDHMRRIYKEALKRGTKVERFRLEKGSDQIKLLHGGWKGFSFMPLCARGCVLKRDGSILDLGKATGVPRRRFSENALSLAMAFSVGDFCYYNGGDFSSRVKKPDGKQVDLEDFLAPECPQVDVAKANHHGHHSMTDSLVEAMRPRVVVAGVWHVAHMNRPTMRRLAKAGRPCLYAPGMFPEKRRKEDAAEPWLKDFAPESFSGAHSVIDVAPDGASYRLMMVAAEDTSRRILGAYDFKTQPKTV